MNKSDLIDAIADKAGMSKADAGRALDATIKAVAGALKKGMLQANPVILEPIMDISIRVPKDFIGDIISDLNTKRARVQGMNPEGEYTVVEAQVPQAEILRYAIDMKSITQGRGTLFTGH